jgi:pantothenate kinase type III
MRRILAVDMGNTFTKYALFEDGAIKATGRHPTADTATAAGPLLDQWDVPVVLSSVVPENADKLASICAAKGRQLMSVKDLTQAVISGTSGELGADLLAAAVAARKLYAPAANLIVVGLGTANTMTRIWADGKFGGVHITLGMTPMLEELARRCALVPQFAEALDDIKPGFNTEDAVRGGTLLGLVGIVEAWVGRSRKEMAPAVVTVATGGWSAAVSRHTDVLDHVDGELVLKGIDLLAETVDWSLVRPTGKAPAAGSATTA